jgi:hypothetical protein
MLLIFSHLTPFQIISLQFLQRLGYIHFLYTENGLSQWTQSHLHIEAEYKKNTVYGALMPELNITSPYVHSRVDSKTFTMSNPHARVDLNPMPESTLSPCQGLRIWPLENTH